MTSPYSFTTIALRYNDVISFEATDVAPPVGKSGGTPNQNTYNVAGCLA